MKKIIIAAILFSGFIFTSCGDEIKELLDVKISTKVNKTIPLTIAAGTNSYDKSEVMDLKNADTEKYLDKLKEINIKKLSFKFVNYTGDPAATADCELVVTLGSKKLSLKKIASFIVKNAVDNATVYEVTDANALKEIGTYMFTNKKFPLNFIANTKASAATTVNVEINAELEAKANPL